MPISASTCRRWRWLPSCRSTFLAVVFPLDPLSGLVLLLTAPLIPLFMILIGSLADA